MNPLNPNLINRADSLKQNIMTKELQDFLFQKGKLAIFLRVKNDPRSINELINDHDLENLITKLTGHIPDHLLTPSIIKESLIAHGNKMLATGKFIANFYQKSNANEAYNSMFEYGIKWRKGMESKAYHSEMGLEKIKNISTKNLKNLRNKLEELTSEEELFLQNIINTRFIIKHFTNNPPAKELLSRNELTKRGIEFPRNNSTDFDIALLANNFFVFLSLEPTGDDGKGFKSSSRFGDTCLIFEFNEINQQYIWLSVADQLDPEVKPSKELHLTTNELEIIDEYYQQEIINIENFKTGNFFGQDVIVGLALSIILLIRQLPNETRDRLFAMHSPEQLNLLINGLYRPEIKIPHHLTKINKIEKQEVNIDVSITENSDSRKFLRQLLKYPKISNNECGKYNNLDINFNNLDYRYNKLIDELSKDNLSFAYKHNIICSVLNPRNCKHTMLNSEQRLQFIKFLCTLTIKDKNSGFKHINYLMSTHLQPYSTSLHHSIGTSENQIRVSLFSPQELSMIFIYISSNNAYPEDLINNMWYKKIDINTVYNETTPNQRNNILKLLPLDQKIQLFNLILQNNANINENKITELIGAMNLLHDLKKSLLLTHVTHNSYQFM